MATVNGFRIPIYAVLVPLAPVFHVYARNIERVPASDALLTGLAVLVAYLGLMFLARLLFKRPEETDLLLAVLFSATFFPFVFLQPGSSRWWWIVLWGAIILAIFLWREFRRLLPVLLTAGTGAFILIGAYYILTSNVWFNRAALSSVTANAFDEVPPPTAAPAEKPDIYYLIFDRYLRGDYLQKVYGFDNTPFIDALRSRGFYVAEKSYSNYQRTAHSVVSSLNFDYLDRLETPATKLQADWYPLFQMFQDFRIARILKSLGYQIDFSGTWWDPTRRLGIADVHHNFYELPELPRILYENSLIVDVARWLSLSEADPLYWQCQRSQLMFDAIADSASNKPRFYFAHFLTPHPPFVTHESGRCMDLKEAGARGRNENYIGQLRFANERILKMVDALLSKPGLKPIIILQADEGPWPKRFAGNEVTALGRDAPDVEWQDATPEELREKMAILNAIYAPKLPLSELTPGMTPVNTFRRILKYYFGMPIDPLEDRNKIFLNSDDIYSFKDVTDVLNQQ